MPSPLPSPAWEFLMPFDSEFGRGILECEPPEGLMLIDRVEEPPQHRLGGRVIRFDVDAAALGIEVTARRTVMRPPPALRANQPTRTPPSGSYPSVT
jgi:hypothetical protein